MHLLKKINFTNGIIRFIRTIEDGNFKIIERFNYYI